MIQIQIQIHLLLVHDKTLPRVLQRLICEELWKARSRSADQRELIEMKGRDDRLDNYDGYLKTILM